MLPGTRWLLTQLDGRKVDADGRPYIELDAVDGQVTGFGGCNRLMGSFDVSGDHLRFGPVARTLMACSEEKMRMEDAFLAALHATNRFGIDGRSLTLLDDERVVARLDSTAAHE